jgi:hypothetical protein
VLQRLRERMRSLLTGLAILVAAFVVYGVWYLSLDPLARRCAGFFAVDHACVENSGLSPAIAARLDDQRQNTINEADAGAAYIANLGEASNGLDATNQSVKMSAAKKALAH